MDKSIYKRLLISIAAGVLLFPVKAYAVVDGQDYMDTSNNDVNTQSLKTNVSYDDSGNASINSMSMTTESTGDHGWTEGAMMHTNSITFTIRGCL